MIPPTCEQLGEYHNAVVAAARYVFSHPQGTKAFNDSSRGDIIYTLILHITQRRAIIVFDDDEKIHGILLYTHDPTRHVVHVSHVVGSRVVFTQFAHVWHKWYRGCAVEYYRNSVKKRMNYGRFTKRFGY